jgi:hypothetical protein
MAIIDFLTLEEKCNYPLPLDIPTDPIPESSTTECKLTWNLFFIQLVLNQTSPIPLHAPPPLNPFPTSTYVLAGTEPKNHMGKLLFSS